MDCIGENIYAKSASNSKSKSRKSSTHHNNEKRTSSVSNELSSLANQLNVSNDIVADEPTNEPAEEATEEEAEEAPPAENDGDDAQADEATETSSKNDLVVDDVNCSMTMENVEVETTTDPSSNSEFVHLKKTTTALQSYLEQFQMENNKSNDNGDAFDATEELLKMLDKENNES